jgi:hypothetical protein
MEVFALVLHTRRLNREPKLAAASRDQTLRMFPIQRSNNSTINAAIARHMSERVFYPDTNDVSSTSKVVALSIAVFRFNASTIQRFTRRKPFFRLFSARGFFGYKKH